MSERKRTVPKIRNGRDWSLTLSDSRIQPEPNSGCWLWVGPLDRKGYGAAKIDGQSTGAYRAVWRTLVGPIPDGMYLDHTCMVRSCVNPDHLRIVTPRISALENSNSIAAQCAAKTHCAQGHALDGDNLGRDCNGHRCCVQCRRNRNARSVRAQAEKRKRMTQEELARINERRKARYRARRNANAVEVI